MTNPTLNTLVLGDTTITYRLIRKWKQNISFRFLNFDLVIYAPYSISIHQIEDLLRSKTRWILKHYTHRQVDVLAKDQIRLLGEIVTVRYTIGNTLLVDLHEGVLTITHRSSQSEKSALKNALCILAEREITRTYNDACEVTRSRRGKMTFKNLRSSLGRCSSKGDIVLARRLIHYPREIILAVCYHELAHLTHMNHSKRFYALLESWMPDYRQIMKNARMLPSVSGID